MAIAIERGALMAGSKSTNDLNRVGLLTGLAARISGARRYGRDSRGVASIEMALIFPIMLIVFVGLVDVSNLLSANRRVTLTASTLGDLITQSQGDVKISDLKGFISAASSIMDPFPAESTSLEFYAFSTSGRVWSYKSEGGSCGSELTTSPQMADLMTEGNDVIVSRACYQWEPIIGAFLNIKASTVENQIMLRPRQSARIMCVDCPK
jgi:hypothetical protein